MKPNITTFSFVSGHGRAQWTTVALAVCMVLNLLMALSIYNQVELLSKIRAGQPIERNAALASDLRVQRLALLQLGLLALTATLFSRWIYRAYRNLQAFGVRHLEYSPAWAVGGFFTPYLNLFRPFQVMREIWKGSDPTYDDDLSYLGTLKWNALAISPLVPWWWAMFIASGTIGYIADILARGSSGDVSMLWTVSWLMLVFNATRAAAAVLAILVVRNVDRRQEEKRKRLTAVGASPKEAPLGPVTGGEITP